MAAKPVPLTGPVGLEGRHDRAWGESGSPEPSGLSSIQISVVERLVDTIVASAQAEAGRIDPSGEGGAVDRGAVWAAAAGCEHADDAVGRVVLAAHLAAEALIESARSRVGIAGRERDNPAANGRADMTATQSGYLEPGGGGRIGWPARGAVSADGRGPERDPHARLTWPGRAAGAPTGPTAAGDGLSDGPAAVSDGPSEGSMAAPTAGADGPALARSASTLVWPRPASSVVADPAPWPGPASAPVVELPAQATVAPEPQRTSPETTGHLDERARRRAITAATFVRNLGALLLVFVAYQLWGTALEQHRSQHALKSQFDAALRVAPSSPGAPPPIAPLPGRAVARLQIPKLGIDEYVVEGTSAEDLRKGPGHYVGTPLPGQPGNAAIAGHRTTYGAPFSRLDELAPGDVILTSTAAGGSRYEVAEKPKSVSPSDTHVVANLEDNRLTLTTCTPKYSAARRLVVVAKLARVGAGTPPPAPVAPARRAITVKTDELSWHWGQLVPGVFIGAGLVGLAKCKARIRTVFGLAWGRVILVPVWAAGILLLFETLNRLLPANL